jgi:hypothetical protein
MSGAEIFADCLLFGWAVLMLARCVIRERIRDRAHEYGRGER